MTTKDNTDTKKTTIGLALSGGGARGFAHLGVLQALCEKNIHISMLSGVSAGAIACAYFAAGYQPIEIMELLTKKNYLRFFQPTIPKQGFVKNIALYKLMKDMLPQRIEDLKTPTCITVTNLNSGKLEYLTTGPLARMVLASTSIPIIFQPVVYDNSHYVDGGVMNNMPIEPLLNKCNYVIACNVNPVYPDKNMNSIFKIMERTLNLAMKKDNELKAKQCDIYIEPEKLSKYKLFDFKKARQLFEIGYETTTNLFKNFNISSQNY
jgi:NTE family protein